MDWMIVWTAVGAIATAILVLGLIVAFFQLREVRKGRNSQLAARLYESFRTEELKNILYQVYQVDPSNPEATLNKEDIERILDNISMIGILVASGTFDKTLAIRIFVPWPIRCWSRLRGYVEQKRNERGRYYAKYAEDFTKRCIKYQIENNPKDEWISLTIEGRGKENLVEDLKGIVLSKRELRIAKLKRTFRSAWNPSLREKI